jgi:hypothetical protein
MNISTKYVMNINLYIPGNIEILIIISLKL